MKAFATIDTALARWVADHRLALSTTYRDEEVRSIEIVSENRRRYQIWIDPPHDFHVRVHAWDYKKRQLDLVSSVEYVYAALDDALSEVQRWIMAEQ